MTKSQQGALAPKEANGTLGCISHKHCQQAKGGDPALEGPQLECCAQFCAPQNQVDTDRVERVQQEATILSKGQEERLRELGLFSLQKRKLLEQKAFRTEKLRGESYQCT